jgi:hypothetical protein
LLQYWCLCADRPALKQNYMANNSSFPPSITYKGNWLHKKGCNSYSVEDKQTKLGLFTDVFW